MGIILVFMGVGIPAEVNRHSRWPVEVERQLVARRISAAVDPRVVFFFLTRKTRTKQDF